MLSNILEETNSMTVYISHMSSVTTFATQIFQQLSQYTNQRMKFYGDRNELNKNVHFDIDKLKDNCQKSNKCSDNKFIDKHTKGRELSPKIDHNHNIYVRTFSNAKIRSMKV